MNKTLLTLALLFAAPTALATAPSSSYVQVQDTSTDSTDGAAEQAGEAVDNAAAATGEAVDNAVDATGEAVDNAVDATGEAVDNAGAAVNNAVDPNGDGVVDANNNGTADTREFPWGLLGLLGLFGLLGRNRPATVTTTTDRRPV